MKTIHNFIAFTVFSFLPIFTIAVSPLRSSVTLQIPDSVFLSKEKDSLLHVIDSLSKVKTLQINQLTELKKANDRLSLAIGASKSVNDSLTAMKTKNESTILSMQQNIQNLKKTLSEKNTLLKEKDAQLAKKDELLKDSQHESALSKAKMDGDIRVSSSKVEAKDREIAFLQKANDQKDQLLREKSEELEIFYKQKNTTQHRIDSIQSVLTKIELDLARTAEREKIVTAQYNDLQTKQKEIQNRKKRIRFIQGVGMKNYRTPDWELAPQSAVNSTKYVISNGNGGKIEFDYITGISLSMIDFTKKASKFTYDGGLFVGFGGQNLFKNFYIGPSFKILDFFHVNFGANVAEYQQLKSGFNEGDVLEPGKNIPTVKEWKVNMYMGFTVDFELLTSIPKRL